MPLPPHQRSINVEAKGKATVVSNAAIPKLRPDHVLVRTHSVALNPTDWKHIDWMAKPGVRVGMDFSGIVEEVSPDLTRPFKKGDKIAGIVYGCNYDEPEDGAFAEYVVARSGVALHVPENLSLEEASTLGVGVTTVGQTVYQSLGLPLPGEKGESGTVLIYGGSTATGSLAIQFAKLSGWTVLTTCSKSNFDLVKSHGASAAFDYKDPDCGSQIRSHTSDTLTHVLDCIAQDSSPQICAAAISSKGGKYVSLLPLKFPRSDVQTFCTMAYTAMAPGKAIEEFGIKFDAETTKRDYEFATKFWAVTEKLLKEGKLKAHPPSVGKEGLNGVLDGLQSMREGKVSGKKLVYRVVETP